jgi:hypothetical protein
MFSTWSTQKLTTLVCAVLVCAPAIVSGQESPAAIDKPLPDTSSVAATSSAADDGGASKEKAPTRIYKTQRPVAGFQPVEMFAAINGGEIEVQLIPRDATQSNIFVVNKSDKPLAVEMPQAFAGVPILAQFGGNGGGVGGGGFGGGGGGLGGGGGIGGGGGQGFGGGVGGGAGGGGLGGGGGGLGGGGGGGGLGGGVFNIPPGKRGRMQVATVCLEFHKEDPRPSMKYEIRPITAISTDPVIVEICKMLANDEISQQVAQAAAWHRTDNLSWDDLLNHDRIRLSNGYYEKFFAPEHVFWAREVVAAGTRRAQLAAQQPGQPGSSSWQTHDSGK